MSYHFYKNSMYLYSFEYWAKVGKSCCNTHLDTYVSMKFMTQKTNQINEPHDQNYHLSVSHNENFSLPAFVFATLFQDF